MLTVTVAIGLDAPAAKKISSHCTHESGNLPNPHPCALHLHIRLVKRRRFSKVKSRWAGRVGLCISLIFLAAAAAARMN